MGWFDRLFNPKDAPKPALGAPAAPIWTGPVPNGYNPAGEAQLDYYSTDQALRTLTTLMQDALKHMDAGRNDAGLVAVEGVIRGAARRLSRDWDVGFAWLLAMAAAEKAQVLLAAGDNAGALPGFDVAVDYFERLRRDPKALGDNRISLAHTRFGQGGAHSALGNHPQARQSFQAALALFDPLVNKENRRDLGSLLAKTLLNLGLSYLRIEADAQLAMPYFAQAMQILDRLVNIEGRNDLAPLLQQAREDRDRIMAVLRGDPVRFDRPAPGQPQVDMRKVEEAREMFKFAFAQSETAHPEDALPAATECIAMHERLVFAECWGIPGDPFIIANRLGTAYFLKIRLLERLGRMDDIAKVCEQAIGLYERMGIRFKNNVESRSGLAIAYSHKAFHLTQRGDPAGLECYDKAIALMQELVEGDNQSDLRKLLDETRRERSAAAAKLRAQPDLRPTVWQPGETILDNFVIEKLLGQGGMGQVYLVSNRLTKQRYAVKRTHFQDNDSRRAFLAELQTWIDMLEHPNLVACRFFRTIDGEEVIFADYVEGGSLSEWIETGSLPKLENILDVAIQCAWGLQAAHDRGMVHQDVKPANVLMTADGVAKITDFGLARARAKGMGPLPSQPSADDLVTFAGMTPAYCSPEQAVGRPLNRKTDIWSWGVSVLHMFQGDVTWRSGTSAMEVLNYFLEDGPDANMPDMPEDVAAVLRKCFQDDPEQRWDSLTSVAMALTAAYRRATGKDYPRKPPIAAERRRRPLKRDAGGRYKFWDEPANWLRKAYAGAGQAVPQDALPPGATAEQRDQKMEQAAKMMRFDMERAVADLAAYDEVFRAFQQFLSAGHSGLSEDFAWFCLQKATIHEYAGDASGALALYDRVIDLARNRLKVGFAVNMAVTGKADLLQQIGQADAAVALLDPVIADYEKKAAQPGMDLMLTFLAEFLTKKASCLVTLKDPAQALQLYDRVIGIYEKYNKHAELADALLQKAILTAKSGQLEASLAVFDRVLTAYENVTGDNGMVTVDFMSPAFVWANKAAVLSKLGQHDAALQLCDRAIHVLKRLAPAGQRERLDQLAFANLVRAAALKELNKLSDALATFKTTVGMYDELVDREGRRDLAENLAEALAGMADTHAALGQRPEALPLYDRALVICQEVQADNALTERLRRQRAAAERGQNPVSPTVAPAPKKQAPIVAQAAKPVAAVRSTYGVSPADPILVHKPSGEYDFIASLRCPAGHRLRGHRLGSMGGKCTDPTKHERYPDDPTDPAQYCLVDHYDLVCDGGEFACSLYFDMYHVSAPPQPAPAGLTRVGVAAAPVAGPAAAVVPVKNPAGPPPPVAAFAPRVADDFVARGIALVQKNDLDGALLQFTQAIDQRSPQAAEAHARRARIYLLKGDFDRALADGERAVALDPRSALAFGARGEARRLKNDLDRGLADLNESLRLQPRDDWTLVCRGDTHRLKNLFDQAIADFSAALQVNPQNAWAMAKRGDAYRCKADYDRAIADLSEALRMGLRVAWVHAGRGQAYRQKNDLILAIADLTEAIRLDPGYAWAFAIRGETYRHNNEIVKAIADFTEAIRLFPQYSWAFANRGEAYRMLNDFTNALRDFDEAIRLDPNNAYAFGSRGGTLRQIGNFDAARADLEYALRLDPNDGWAKDQLAMAMRRQA